MLFKPTFWIKNVLEINEAFLADNDIKGFVLDLDNTLSMHGNPAEEEGIMDWLAQMKQLNIGLFVVSNNTEKRVQPLAQKLGIPYVAFGCKPLTGGITKAIKKMGLKKSEVCVVGDQIFTDIMGGNLARTRTILVEPFELEKGSLFKIKRKAESIFFKRDYSKLKVKGERK